MDDGFLNWGFMPSTTGYVLISAGSEYATVDTALLKAGSMEDVYNEFTSKVRRTHINWFSVLLEDNLPQDMRAQLAEKSDEMIDFLENTPIPQIKEILEPAEIPIGLKKSAKIISFHGGDWDYYTGFSFHLRGPYSSPMKYVKYQGGQWVRDPTKSGRVISMTPEEIKEGGHYDYLKMIPPVCYYQAEDSIDEYYGTNIALMKLET